MLFCCARIRGNPLLKRVIPHYNFAIGSLSGIVLMPRIRPAVRIIQTAGSAHHLRTITHFKKTTRTHGPLFFVLRVFRETLFMHIETVVSITR